MYCIDTYVFLIFIYMIVQMYKMRAILTSDSEQELSCKIKSLEKHWAIFVASYLVVWFILAISWGFIQLSDDQYAFEHQELMKYSIVGYYIASVTSAILVMYLIIKFLSICHTYAMLYYQGNKCARRIVFLVEIFTFILYEFGTIARDTLFPVKHTQLIFDEHNFFERYQDILNMISDAVSTCDSFDKFILGMVVLKCFDHFGSQPDAESSQQETEHCETSIITEENEHLEESMQSERNR